MSVAITINTMGISRCLLMFIIIAGFFGCDGNGQSDLDTLQVDRYVEQLRKGKYDSYELPAFTADDIPALLAYSKETQQIKGFPTNPISSAWTAECSLGMYVLWTIESIRAVSIDSKFLIGRFPSQNPFVELKKDPSAVITNTAVQEDIVAFYFDWWENNKGNDFEEYKHIDPLATSIYRWH